eukprot:SAG11_NODE_126_length_15729_cov_9.966859_14_plen_228_part_00
MCGLRVVDREGRVLVDGLKGVVIGVCTKTSSPLAPQPRRDSRPSRSNATVLTRRIMHAHNIACAQYCTRTILNIASIWRKKQRPTVAHLVEIVRLHHRFVVALTGPAQHATCQQHLSTSPPYEHAAQMDSSRTARFDSAWAARVRLTTWRAPGAYTTDTFSRIEAAKPSFSVAPLCVSLDRYCTATATQHGPQHPRHTSGSWARVALKMHGSWLAWLARTTRRGSIA